MCGQRGDTQIMFHWRLGNRIDLLREHERDVGGYKKGEGGRRGGREGEERRERG